jgi:hypothetical protein
LPVPETKKIPQGKRKDDKSMTDTQNNQKSQYYFKFVDFEKVVTTVELTSALLNLRLSGVKLEMDNEIIPQVFQAIDAELTRLNECTMKDFLDNVKRISEDIHNIYIQNEKISYNQIICIFNLMYGLSKCFVKSK